MTAAAFTAFLFLAALVGALAGFGAGCLAAWAIRQGRDQAPCGRIVAAVPQTPPPPKPARVPRRVPVIAIGDDIRVRWRP
ncbi:hypothetical protein SAMN05216376_105209 [Mameliella alba]|uniref:hypothetical protein n=1 Tax=Mameliella alba TaxID=561184 RepID=UPI00087F675E|nr:hypothetical protein [Mameliella alba]OWV48259.1 hypothetical protein CDZ96_10605 [Mameliella alba]PTR40300.1 hypothetical protein LX94_01782 [Mameliella alba]GGF43876.1 hypothetical protein GCM10011319_02100 [Mameliella alba]SDC98670.1 hypothetical protein SAMN05216376_105209 [Mameliella alba]